MLLIAMRKGGGPCGTDCPFYTDKGQVTGVRGVPLKTHCRMTMNPWMVDCDIYNVRCLDKIEVTEDEFKRMLQAIGRRAIRQRKLYPEDHENANQVGCEWTRRRASAGEQPFGSKGKWNSEKSNNVKK